MTKLHNVFKTTRLSIWLLACILILAATSVYAAGDQRPLAAVDILGSPDAAVTGKLAVGTATPGNKTLTVAGVIDFVGAGSVHNYFTQGPGNNMQIRSNVDEYNAVGDGTYSQWNMVMGASLDVFSIRRSPIGSTYNEDALFWIEGGTGNVGIAKVDTSNGATIPFTTFAKLHVETDSSDAIWGVVTATSGYFYGVYGQSDSTSGRGVFAYASATSGTTYGLYGVSDSTAGRGVFGYAGSVTGTTYGVYGKSESTNGSGVFGGNDADTGNAFGVYGQTESTYGIAVYGLANATSGLTQGVVGQSNSTWGTGVWGYVGTTSGGTQGVYGEVASTSGLGVGGYANASSGNTIGVWGESASNTGKGLAGYASSTTGSNYGVSGWSASTSGYDFYASGPGTDYGPFTGAHEALLDDSFPAEVKVGMIVSATGETHIRTLADGSVDISSTLPTVRLADRPEDKAVLGVLVAEIDLPGDHWYSPAAGERFASINALGEGRVWVTNINGDIEAGDAITSSAIPGYGQKQDGDFVHIYTLGKATDTVDWDTVTDTVIFNGQEYKVYLLGVVYTSG
jgi:hypothetical protein